MAKVFWPSISTIVLSSIPISARIVATVWRKPFKVKYGSRSPYLRRGRFLRRVPILPHDQQHLCGMEPTCRRFELHPLKARRLHLLPDQGPGPFGQAAKAGPRRPFRCCFEYRLKIRHRCPLRYSGFPLRCSHGILRNRVYTAIIFLVIALPTRLIAMEFR